MPVISSVNATPSIVCAGSPAQLTAQSIAAAAGLSASIGNGTAKTDGYRGINCIFVTGGHRTITRQYSRLRNYLPLVWFAGNITSITYNISTVGDASSTTAYTVKVG